MKVLVINSGSSSIKYQVFNMPEAEVLAKGLVEKIGEEDSLLKHSVGDKKKNLEGRIADHGEGLQKIITLLTDEEYGVVKDINEIGAVGHRVVHGGEAHADSVVITESVMKTIEEYSSLAPLHNPPNLTGIKAAGEVLGDKTPQVAVFDTAFHQTMPEKAYIYAIPYKYYRENKIRRYGFHGTSHRYVTQAVAKELGKPESEVNVITCHLGNGGSMAAIKNGKSIDTTMGLTPLEGLVMGTRSGDLDPAIVFFLNEGLGIETSEINKILNKKSGLLGISEVSNDMRAVIEKAEEGHAQSKLAIEVFGYRIRKYIGAYMAVLNNLDAIVFTGGIGENNASMRARVTEELDNWGIKVDADLNEKVNHVGGLFSKTDSKVKLYVIPTDEEKAIAIDTYELVK